MSEKNKSKIKVVRIKHIRGNNSISNQNILITDNNKKFDPSNKSKQSNRSKTNSRVKKAFESLINKSFNNRRKNNNEIDDINIKMISYNSMSKNKKSNGVQHSKIALKTNNKKPYHNRIKSFQMNARNNEYIYHNNKTDRYNFKDNKQKMINKNKINNLIGKNNGESNDNDYSIDKNKKVKKTNSVYEDNESTKNTKISEQKALYYDNYNDNKFLILSHKSKNSGNSIINEIKKLKNFDIKNESMNKNKNKFIMKTKLDNLKKNNSITKEHGYIDNSPSKKKLKNEDIIQKIKDKLELLKATIEENNNSGRYRANKEISSKNNDKSVELNNTKNKKMNNNNNYNSKYGEKNLMKKVYSPINLKFSFNEDMSSEQKKYSNSSAKNRNYKPKIKVHNNKINRNERKNNNNKNNNSNYKINNKSFCQKQKQKKVNYYGTRSQQELKIDFIEKALNNDENKNKSKNKSRKKGKKPKDLSEKEIKKIESICKKGFLGADVEKTNQDNYFIYKNFIDNPDYIFFGVCDGHGAFGHEVSGYLVYDIPLTINELLSKKRIRTINENNIPKIITLLKKSFVQIDKNLSRETKIDTTFSGSTCVSLIFTPSKLLCINLGDSRCVIGKFDEKRWIAKALSFDHKPDLKMEKERIIKNGGRIEPYINDDGEYYGPERVWLKNSNVPGLAMSRSFGDLVAHSVGVSSEPEIIEYSFLEEDKFIILASDGIWEFISNKECVDIIKDYYIKNDINGAINFLYKESTKRWIINEEIIDDITLIIIFLK